MVALDTNRKRQAFYGRIEQRLDGCWNWTGTRTAAGYGVTGIRAGGETRAHRLSYRVHIGEIPNGKVIHHACENPACVRPEHLEAVTDRENLMASASTQARINSEKTHCIHGHPLSGDNLTIQVLRNGKEKRRCKACARRHRLESIERGRSNRAP